MYHNFMHQFPYMFKNYAYKFSSSFPDCRKLQGIISDSKNDCLHYSYVKNISYGYFVEQHRNGKETSFSSRRIIYHYRYINILSFACSAIKLELTAYRHYNVTMLVTLHMVYVCCYTLLYLVQRWRKKKTIIRIIVENFIAFARELFYNFRQ